MTLIPRLWSIVWMISAAVPILVAALSLLGVVQDGWTLWTIGAFLFVHAIRRRCDPMFIASRLTSL